MVNPRASLPVPSSPGSVFAAADGGPDGRTDEGAGGVTGLGAAARKFAGKSASAVSLRATERETDGFCSSCRFISYLSEWLEVRDEGGTSSNFTVLLLEFLDELGQVLARGAGSRGSRIPATWSRQEGSGVGLQGRGLGHPGEVVLYR